MNSHKIVVQHMKRDGGAVILNPFFENAFVRRVNRRMPIRIVRFSRSI
jgi:hypothetical protein